MSTAIAIIQKEEPKLYEQFLLLPPEKQSEFSDIYLGWAQRGLSINMSLYQLQLRVLQLKPKIPTTLEELPAAKTTLENLKKEYKEIKKTMDAATDPLKDKIESIGLNTFKILLAESKKGNTGYIAELEAAILPLESKRLNQERAVAQRSQTLRDFRAIFEKSYTDQVADFDKKINTQITHNFNYALDNVTTAYIAVHLELFKKNITASFFNLLIPTNPDAEINAIAQDVFSKFVVTEYIEKFHLALNKTFSDFANAKSNKDLAKQRMADAIAASNKKIEEDALFSNLGTTVQSQTTTVPVASSAKSLLKNKWVIDYPQPLNWEHMINIIAAFIVNNQYCASHIKVLNNENLSVKQMGEALCKIKEDDVNFQVNNIPFKQIEIM